MEKYIIAVDMDGTLLNSENKISERNRNVLQRLIDDGHYVVPATGRTRELIPQEFSVLRNGRIRIPRGQDMIQVGDTVIIVTTHKGLRDITDILEK